MRARRCAPASNRTAAHGATPSALQAKFGKRRTAGDEPAAEPEIEWRAACTPPATSLARPRDFSVVAIAHPLGGLAHLAGAVAHVARAVRKPVGGVDQLLMGDGVAAGGLAGDDLLAIATVAEPGR